MREDQEEEEAVFFFSVCARGKRRREAGKFRVGGGEGKCIVRLQHDHQCVRQTAGTGERVDAARRDTVVRHSSLVCRRLGTKRRFLLVLREEGEAVGPQTDRGVESSERDETVERRAGAEGGVEGGQAKRGAGEEGARVQPT